VKNGLNGMSDQVILDTRISSCQQRLSKSAR
jgi:hypothetical protein